MFGKGVAQDSQPHEKEKLKGHRIPLCKKLLWGIKQRCDALPYPVSTHVKHEQELITDIEQYCDWLVIV